MDQTIKARAKKFTYFIGIDVSKNKLDYAVMFGKDLLFHRERKNDPDDITDFVMQLKELPRFTLTKAVFCMEHSGLYCNHLLFSLKKLKTNVVVEHPLHIKRSLGLTRGKDDKADCIRIAAYAQKNREELRLWSSKRMVILQLANLVALRNRLLTTSVALNNPLNEEAVFLKRELRQQSKKLCVRTVEAIKEDLININISIDGLFNADEQLKKLKTLITSVPGIGLMTAIQVIITTNEFIDIRSPKKFACYAGVAPFKKESGTTNHKAKVSNIANKKMKSLLHLCALGAIKADDQIKAYYIRKTQTEGKAKLSVINAVRYKLILRVFACVNKNRLYIVNNERNHGKTASELSIE